MAVHEQELVWILLAADLDDGQQAAHPALAQPRPHRRADRSALQLRDQRLAVRMIDADDRRRRLAADRLGGRRAPDRRADAFVNALARMDVDLRDRAAAFERLHRPRHREPFGEDDPSSDGIGAAGALLRAASGTSNSDDVPAAYRDGT